MKYGKTAQTSYTCAIEPWQHTVGRYSEGQITKPYTLNKMETDTQDHQTSSVDLQEQLHALTGQNVSKWFILLISLHMTIVFLFLFATQLVIWADYKSVCFHLTLVTATWQKWTTFYQSGLPGEQTGSSGQLQHRSILQAGPEWRGEIEGTVCQAHINYKYDVLYMFIIYNPIAGDISFSCHLSDIQGACGGENSDKQDERAVWRRDVWAKNQGESLPEVIQVINKSSHSFICWLSQILISTEYAFTEIRRIEKITCVYH